MGDMLIFLSMSVHINSCSFIFLISSDIVYVVEISNRHTFMQEVLPKGSTTSLATEKNFVSTAKFSVQGTNDFFLPFVLLALSK
jgi:hypothetical protein